MVGRITWWEEFKWDKEHRYFLGRWHGTNNKMIKYTVPCLFTEHEDTPLIRKVVKIHGYDSLCHLMDTYEDPRELPERRPRPKP